MACVQSNCRTVVCSGQRTQLNSLFSAKDYWVRILNCKICQGASRELS